MPPTQPTRPPGRFTIEKTFAFSASHELRNLPEGHQCRRNHGHNYAVTLTVTAAELDEFGMVTDFGDLAPFGEFLRTKLDHRLLNDVLDVHPTSENLARFLGWWFIDNVEPTIRGRLVSVRVAETNSSSALWERPYAS